MGKNIAISFFLFFFWLAALERAMIVPVLTRRKLGLSNHFTEIETRENGLNFCCYDFELSHLQQSDSLELVLD